MPPKRKAAVSESEAKPETKTSKKEPKAKAPPKKDKAPSLKVKVPPPKDKETKERISKRKIEKPEAVEEIKEPKTTEPKSKKKAQATKEEKPEKKTVKTKVAKVDKKEETKKPDRKKKQDSPTPETETKNKTDTQWNKTDYTCTKSNTKGEQYNLKITSWNVDGIRAWLKKDGLKIIEHDNPDILCLQETKCSESKLPEELKNVEGYRAYWCSSKKEGYAGVAILTKIEPIKVKNGIDDEDQDEDGRCITAEFEKFHLICTYVPNAGRKLVTLPKRLKWNESFKSFVKKLDKKKPVIICGDMNVAHNEIDLANPKTNTKNAGFTVEEREGMTDFLSSGFVDSYRKFYPDKKDVYTFWTYMSSARARNVGWRLDYFLVSDRVMDNICDIVIYDKIYGSDHCPISLFINI